MYIVIVIVKTLVYEGPVIGRDARNKRLQRDREVAADVALYT